MYKVGCEQTVPAVGHVLDDMSPLRIYAPLHITAAPVTHLLCSLVLYMTILDQGIEDACVGIAPCDLCVLFVLQTHMYSC